MRTRDDTETGRARGEDVGANDTAAASSRVGQSFQLATIELRGSSTVGQFDTLQQQPQIRQSRRLAHRNGLRTSIDRQTKRLSRNAKSAKRSHPLGKSRHGISDLNTSRTQNALKSGNESLGDIDPTLSDEGLEVGHDFACGRVLVGGGIKDKDVVGEVDIGQETGFQRSGKGGLGEDKTRQET